MLLDFTGETLCPSPSGASYPGSGTALDATHRSFADAVSHGDLSNGLETQLVITDGTSAREVIWATYTVATNTWTRTAFISSTTGSPIAWSGTVRIICDVSAVSLLHKDRSGVLVGSLSTDSQIVSTLSTGTSPLSIVSTTVVANLNSDLLDGLEATAFALASHSHTLSAITDAGDLAALSAVGTSQLDDEAVTYAKMQHVAAASRLLGRGSAGGAGDPEEITLGAGLTMTGTSLSATGGGTTIGDAVSGATNNCILYVDSSGNLANTSTFTYDGTKPSNTQGRTQGEAFGDQANLTGNFATAFGYDATAAQEGVAVGRLSQTTGSQAVAVGNSASAGLRSVAIGNSAIAGNNDVAIGYAVTATGVSIGGSITATGNDQVAVGKSLTMGAATRSIAVGNSVTSDAEDSIAIGFDVDASGARAVCIGRGTYAENANAVAIGYGSQAKNSGDFVCGSSGQPKTDVYFGSGRLHTSPADYTVRGSGSSDSVSNNDGGTVSIFGGFSTGNGGSKVRLGGSRANQGSGSTHRTPEALLEVEHDGTNTKITITLDDLPTSNPGAGILWNDSGTLKVGT